MSTSPLRFFFSGLWLSIPVAAGLAVVLFVYPGADDPLSNIARPLLLQALEWLLRMAEALGTGIINIALAVIACAHLLGMLLNGLRLNRPRKAAALNAERTRSCPSCSALIQVDATICRHCHAQVQRPYVDEHFAGQQMQKLLSMHAFGMTDREIAERLNRNGELLLRDHSVWTARKIAKLLAQAKKANGAA